MEYQLVLQFPGDLLESYDSMIALEEELIEALGNSAEVDGHDIGTGVVNIYILTSDPIQTFAGVTPVVRRSRGLEELKAAYRRLDSDDFTVVWPKDTNSGQGQNFSV